MILKVFMPENLISQQKSCQLYGEVAIEEKSLSYFVISSNNEIEPKYSSLSSSSLVHQFRKLGDITEPGRRNLQKDVLPILIHFNSSNLYLYLTNLGIKEIEDSIINIFLYNDNTILSLNFSYNNCENQHSDINFLKSLIHEKNEILQKQTAKTKTYSIMNLFKFFFLKIIYRIIIKIQNIKLLSRLLLNTALNDQMNDWIKCIKRIEIDKNNSNKQIWTFIFDIIAGLLIMLLLLIFYIKPDEYLINTSQTIVIKLRILLESLKGSPIGLKLNKQLNNFLLDCFKYHVNLWATFLITISPIIHYLFIPIGIIGILGLSFQLAMLSDLIVLISLHAHCFYIYAAVLYNIEKYGLLALWNVFLGKRRNILKNRIESYDYMNRQLYISTIFFTILLFLLPTILVYYTVFATLRIFIYLLCYILMKIRKKILIEFRIDLFCKWLIGNYYDSSSIEIEYLDSIKSEQLHNKKQISILKLKAIKSSWKYIFLRSNHIENSSHNTYMTLKQFMSGILKGEMINFSQVKSN